MFLRLALVVVFSLAIAGCGEGAASYESNRRFDSSSEWLEHQENVSSCRDDQTDLGHGFGDQLHTKISLGFEHAERLDCSQLMQLPQSDHTRIVISEKVHSFIPDPEELRLAKAGQWVTLNRNVLVCSQQFKPLKTTSSEGLLSGWSGQVLRASEPHPADSEVVVLVRNCGGDNVFFVVPDKVPAEIQMCGEADIPRCGSPDR